MDILFKTNDKTGMLLATERDRNELAPSKWSMSTEMSWL